MTNGMPGKQSIFGGSTQRQQLLRIENLQTIVFSIQSLLKALRHPYVLKKLRICLKPIAIAASIVYVAGLALLIPLSVVSILTHVVSVGYLNQWWLVSHGKSWVKESVAIVPFLAVLTMKTLIKQPLSKCLVHLLQEINPEAAAQMGSRELASKKSSAETTKVRYSRAIRICRKAAFLLLADAVLGYARRGQFLGSVILGRCFVAASHFYTMKKVLGRDRAVILALLGLVPYLEPWILKFVQIWRASNLLGQELLTDYLSACVPSLERGAFLKSHDVDIPLFAMPGSLLLLIPVVGPLFLVPVQASTAFLVDKISKERLSSLSSTVHQERAPSLPAGAPPI